MLPRADTVSYGTETISFRGLTSAVSPTARREAKQNDKTKEIV